MELTRIIHSSILESPVPAKILAKKIGKPYSTLLREVNPYDEGAKLGVETFVQILKFNGDFAPSDYIASELAMEITPMTMRKAG